MAGVVTWDYGGIEIVAIRRDWRYLNTAGVETAKYGQSFLTVCIFQAISRQDPYEGESMEDVLKEIADETLTGLPKRPAIPEGCPEKISSIMRSCWHR